MVDVVLVDEVVVVDDGDVWLLVEGGVVGVVVVVDVDNVGVGLVVGEDWIGDGSGGNGRRWRVKGRGLRGGRWGLSECGCGESKIEGDGED